MQLVKRILWFAMSIKKQFLVPFGKLVLHFKTIFKVRFRSTIIMWPQVYPFSLITVKTSGSSIFSDDEGGITR